MKDNTLVNNGLVFIDAYRQHARYPTTFKIPDKEDLDALEIGSYIQIGIYVKGFETEAYLEVSNDTGRHVEAERLWFEIINIYEDYYTARLRSYPIALDLKYDTLLKMERKHILKVE